MLMLIISEGPKIEIICLGKLYVSGMMKMMKDKFDKTRGADTLLVDCNSLLLRV